MSINSVIKKKKLLEYVGSFILSDLKYFKTQHLISV